MSENSLPEHCDGPMTSVGAMLRAKREELGLTPEQVAEAIKLRARQVLAMESDDFQSLGSVPHVKGFLRNYARHLRLDAADVLALLPQEARPAEPDLRGPDHTGVSMPTPGGRKPLAWALAVSPLVLLALGAGILYALGVNFDRWRSAVAPSAPASASAEAHPGAPAAVPVVAPAPVVVPVPGAVAVASGAHPAAQAPAVPGVSAAPPPAAPATLAPAPALPALAAPNAVQNAPASTAPAGQALSSAHRLVLNFLKESWVEIKDAGGRTLLSQKVPGGNTRILEGKPPFAVVIGNASAVQLQYDDRPVDLAPFTKVDVARLNLN